MATPSRFTSGLTQSAPWQALGNMGMPNPLYYHLLCDDFDDFVSGAWTVTAQGTPTTAFTPTAGVGGVITTLTAATIANGSIITKPAAGFNLTATTGAGAAPKVFFATRISGSLIANAVLFAGLVNTVTAPFTSANITDGIWFSKANAGGLVLNYQTGGGTVQSVTIPTSAYTLANSTFFDLSFQTTSQGSILASVGTNMMGRVPQSGSGANTPAQLYPIARLTPAAVPLTSVLLNPTVGFQTGTASIQAFNIDYVLAAQER